MTSEERKQLLSEIQKKHEPYTTGVPLVFHGERKQFNVYRIPLDILTYNPYNGRIGSVVKSFERQNHTLDANNPEDIKIIEDFLWKSKETANKKTIESLLNDHQQKFGIVTADGKIIDGNRRASLLNKIWNDNSIDVNKKQHCQYFYAIILPTDADKKEILRLETTYQMGEDAKVDYNPIEKYLKCGDLDAEGFTVDEIASFMGINKAEVQTQLRVLNLMNDYLEYCGYDGMYTQLGNNEDSFIKLESALKKYKAGGVTSMWDYEPDTDVTDLKSCAFDYIRLGFHQDDFRDIIRTPKTSSSSFFASKEIWESFRDKHFSIVEEIQETPVDNLIKENPLADVSRLLKMRDNEWREKVKDNLNRNYEEHHDKLSNKQESNEPLRLLNKALDALLNINNKSLKSIPFNEVNSRIYSIESKLDELKNSMSGNE
ncbi:MAG: hypothetical protein FJZ66_00045 [Bacteroidetes bacterium]|nr:hypothetical protein [Bacteroidota bacterium]